MKGAPRNSKLYKVTALVILVGVCLVLHYTFYTEVFFKLKIFNGIHDDRDTEKLIEDLRRKIDEVEK